MLANLLCMESGMRSVFSFGIVLIAVSKGVAKHLFSDMTDTVSKIVFERSLKMSGGVLPWRLGTAAWLLLARLQPPAKLRKLHIISIGQWITV
jgi:hypothetical protein